MRSVMQEYLSVNAVLALHKRLFILAVKKKEHPNRKLLR